MGLVVATIVGAIMVSRCGCEKPKPAAAPLGQKLLPRQHLVNRPRVPQRAVAKFARAAPVPTFRAPARLNRGLTQQEAANLYYDTVSGNTENVAAYIGEAAGIEGQYIADAEQGDIEAADGLIVGAPTWHTGAEEQRSQTQWDEWLYDTLPGVDVAGKKVAIFGVGDQEGYSDNYCDAAGELYDRFTEAGAEVVGMTSTDGYNHTDSKAIRDGKFVGLMCDEDNEADMSEERAAAWVEQLKADGFPF
jgi:flavodoxin I